MSHLPESSYPSDLTFLHSQMVPGCSFKETFWQTPRAAPLEQLLWSTQDEPQTHSLPCLRDS